MEMSIQNDSLLERAKLAVLSRDFDSAIRIYKGLLKSDPENMELLNELGGLYIKSGHDGDALNIYKEIVRLNPKSVSALNSLGGILRRLKMYDESIAVLEKAAMLDSENSQVYYNMGFTYKLMEQYDEAIRCFNTVVEANSSDVLAYNHLGAIYAQQKKYPEAVNSYLHGLKVDPNHPILHLNIAKSYDAMGEFEKARNEYEIALKTKPGWLEAITNYADFLLKYNKTHAAGELVRKAIALNSKNSHIYSKYGDVCYRQGDYKNAETHYNEALDICQESKRALIGLAKTYEKTERYDESLGIMSRVEDFYPSDSVVQKQYSSILLSAGLYEEASAKIQSLYENNQNDLETLDLLGQYYICTGDEKKAYACYKRIKGIDPKYSDFYLNGAKRYVQKNEFSKAEEFYDRYADVNPQSVQCYELMAENFEKQNKLDQALASFRRASSLDQDNVSSKAGVDRVSENLISLGSENFAQKSNENEFDDVDENISLSPSVSEEELETEAEAETVVVTDVAENETEQSPEEEDYNIKNYDSGFSKLTEEGVSEEDIFDSGKLDETVEADNQQVYKQSLDDLVGEDDSRDENSVGLVEDNMDADEFFADNTFGRQQKNNPVEDAHSFEPEFEEEDVRSRDKNDDIVSLDEDEDDDYGFEEEEKPVKEKRKREAEKLPEDDFSFEDEDLDFEPERVEKYRPRPERKEPKEDYNPDIFSKPVAEFAQRNKQLDNDMLEQAEESLGALEQRLDELAAEKPRDPMDEMLMGEDPVEEAEDEIFEDEILEEQTEEPADEPLEEIETDAVEEEVPEESETELDVAEEDPLEETEAEFAEEELFEEPEAETSEEEFLEEPEAEIAEEELLEEAEAETAEEELLEESEPAVEEEVVEESLTGSEPETETEIDPKAALFLKLKNLIEYLPDEKRKEFKQSKVSVQLDFIISKFEGGKGLLVKAEDVHDDETASDYVEQETGKALLIKTLELSKNLAENLSDEKMISSMNSRIDGLIEKL